MGMSFSRGGLVGELCGSVIEYANDAIVEKSVS
jgi:hypothetical protein